MTRFHTIAADNHRCLYCWSVIRAGDLHHAHIANSDDERNPNEPRRVERAHMGCSALAAQMPRWEKECPEDDPWDSNREALDYHYPDAKQLSRNLSHMLARASAEPYHHPNAEFARMVRYATWNDLRRVEARYRHKPSHRDRTDVAEVREAAHAEMMATVEAWCAMDQIVCAIFIERPATDASLEEVMAAERARDEAAIHARIAAIRHTDAMLAQHGLPPEQPHELRRQMLTRLLDGRPKEPTP
jgi:hypothetical protein